MKAFVSIDFAAKSARVCRITLELRMKITIRLIEILHFYSKYLHIHLDDNDYNLCQLNVLSI